MRIQGSQFHTWSRLLKQLPPAESTISKFTLQKSTITINNIAGVVENAEVVLNGWIDKKPKKISKNLNFGLLRDHEGNTLQLVDTKSLLKHAAVEDVVQARGHLSPKKDSDSALELKLNSMTTLNRSNRKPSELQDFKETGDYPPEYRFLQLRLHKYQAILKKRNSITKSVRDTLNDQGFIEIETPLLFKSTPEGAREFLVPSRKVDHNSKRPTFYALPQSPQQYKQLLIASGVNKYFQLARCFRDEDLRADRQPEFTQIDLEMAFSSANDVMQVVEKLLVPLWKQYSASNSLLTLNSRGRLVSVDKEDPICHMTYKQAMTQYGIDKPDLRAPDLKIMDLTEFKARGYTNKDFPVFEILILRNAFDSKESLQQNASYFNNANNYNSRVPIIVPIEDEKDANNWFEKFMTLAAFENPKLISKFLKLKKGDIICGSTRQHSFSLFENPTPLGRLRQLVLDSDWGKERYQKTNKDVATWVVDFPLFSPKEKNTKEDKKYDYPSYCTDAVTSTHHPFTMVKLSDYEKLQTNPLQCSGQHYDLVVSGVEVGGGSTRIHDAELQDYIFENILQIKNSDKLFGHLLRAFRMGTPPHAGFAVGFDRLCAMLCGTESIRDVIAFPKSITGSDLVVGCPTVVDEKTINMYNIRYNSKS